MKTNELIKKKDLEGGPGSGPKQGQGKKEFIDIMNKINQRLGK